MVPFAGQVGETGESRWSAGPLVNFAGSLVSLL